MALVRWDPLQLMRWPDLWDEETLAPTGAAGNLDIYETENEVVVRANVAGIPEEKVDITYEKGVLWIRAEEEVKEEKEKKYYRRASRSYSYKVAVPGNIDAKAEPRAEIENGVVEIAFKKAEEAKPKKISVGSKNK